MDIRTSSHTRVASASLQSSVQRLWTLRVRPRSAWYGPLPPPSLSLTAAAFQTNVRLPLPVEGTGPDARPIYTKAVQAQIARFLQQRFFETWNTHPGVYVHSGAVWTRISVQVWTEVRRVVLCAGLI